RECSRSNSLDRGSAQLLLPTMVDRASAAAALQGRFTAKRRIHCLTRPSTLRAVSDLVLPATLRRLRERDTGRRQRLSATALKSVSCLNVDESTSLIARIGTIC